ncbi:hypothetical protein CRENBAI_020050 [Crenichthys baileyi]|uniref:Uncharacterized protein n=1 Tax=Crenichthys baileyi TaxID=28760 RepID=A0AAV9RWW2_9TELE
MMKSGTFSKWPLHWTCALKQKTDDSVWDQILRKLIEQSTEEHCGEDGMAMLSENEETVNEEEECVIVQWQNLCRFLILVQIRSLIDVFAFSVKTPMNLLFV